MRVLRISHSAVVGAWRERESAIRRLGVQVRLISAHSWNEGGAEVPLVPRSGEDVVGAKTFGTHTVLFLYDPRPIWRELGKSWDVIDIHEDPYALVTAEILFLKWLRRQRAPFVLYTAQNIYKRYPPPFRWLERYALQHAAALSVCNTESARIARIKGLRGAAAYIPLGVDIAHFSPADRPAMIGGGPIRVGYVGRLESRKGVQVLLEAIAAHPRLHLDVAGGGPAETVLRARAAEPDLLGRVTFHGHLDQQQLRDLYRTLDVLAVPSLPTASWLEQFCRVAVEAMASGVPVVASRSGALPDVVGGAGLLVPAGNPAALTDAFLRLADDPQKFDQLRAAGLVRAGEFSWDRVGEDYVGLYRSIAPTAWGLSAGRVPRDPTAALAPDETRGLEVIVVAFGAADMFRRAIAPIAGQFPLTVIDNSADPAIRDATEEAGGRYLVPGGNLGFGAAVNFGLARRQVPGGDVLLLNPDAVIDAESIRQLHKHLIVNPVLATVGPAQVDTDGRPGRVLWPFPSPARAWLEAVGLGRKQSAANYVIGSVLLIRCEALDEVGPFDEQFFLYAEETDWAYRAHRAGWTHALVDSITAVHVGAGTGGDPARREVQFHSSNELYLRKHFGTAGWQLSRAAVVLGAGVRAMVLPGNRRAAARTRLGIYARGPARQARRGLGLS